MIRLLVGDTDESIAVRAQGIDQDAQLVTEQFSSLSDGVYYTSLGDFSSVVKFVDVLDQADVIEYSPPTKWSDDNMRYWTEYYLMYFYNRKPVKNFFRDPIDRGFLRLADIRKTESRQLWVAGCSFSDGTGVDKSERYGQLIADQLKLPVSFLTARSSSIDWAKDQILRSDIRKGDIVVWGLTSIARFPYYNNDKIEHISLGTYLLNPEFEKVFALDHLIEQNMDYRALTSVDQVVNFCRKVGAQLVICGLLVEDYMLKYLYKLPEYLQAINRFGTKEDELYLDLGTDNKHPGPLTHRWYADEIIKFL